MARRILLLALCALLLCFSLPLTGQAITGCVVEEDDDAVTLFATGEWMTRSEKWLSSNFPKLRSLETTQTRFVFASAPEVVKTRAVLNKTGESLTLYRFKTNKDVQKCLAMIKGNTLVYGGKTVYVDTLFPATYYVDGRVIALYCGADTTVDKKLKETFQVAGGYGGYFDRRSEAAMPEGANTVIVSPPKDEAAPATLKALLKKADSIYIAKVKQTPKWVGESVEGVYELEVTKNIRGISRKSFRLEDWPGVMHAGRTYVLYIKHMETPEGGTRLIYADWVNHSTFEIDDRGYVLPIREYGMKAPVKLEKFLKGL